MKKSNFFVSIEGLTWYGFIAISIFFLLVHEPWRDEAQAWLIARDHPSLWSMLQMSRYEVAPMLWHVILFGLSHLGLPYLTQFIFHSVIAAANAFLVLRFAPFTRLQRVLIVFGYFFLYEYNAIARNYALTVLLMLLLALTYHNHFKRPALFFSLLFLLAASSLHGLIISGVFAAVFLYEWLVRRGWRSNLRALNVRTAVSMVLYAIGTFFILLWLWPDANVGLPGSVPHGAFELIYRVAVVSFRQLIPLSPFVLNFWDTPLITNPVRRS